MAAQHTPGPWRVEGWENVTVNLPNGDTLTTAPGPKNAPLSELKANAALIAAAPDLLNLLERAVGILEDEYPASDARRLPEARAFLEAVKGRG